MSAAVKLGFSTNDQLQEYLYFLETASPLIKLKPDFLYIDYSVWSRNHIHLFAVDCRLHPQ